MKLKLLLTSLLFSVTTSTSQAKVTSYVPLKQSPELERHIDKLMIQAQMTVSKHPISTTKVKQAYDKVCETSSDISCKLIKAYLNKQTGLALQHASIKVKNKQDQTFAAKNARGNALTQGYTLNTTATWYDDTWFGVSVGGNLNDDDFTPENTFVSFGTDWAQIDIGYKPHWFSPFSQSAMLIGTNAETFATISVSNYEPIGSWNFSYELFIGELSHTNRIRYQDGYTSGKPILTGMHFEISPFKGFSFAANRIMQSGGGERGGRSVSDLIKAFIDPNGEDNTSDDLSSDEQFGNQAASFTTRFDFPGKKPFSVYLEYAGEDTNKGSFWRLGNTSLSAGFNIPTVWSNFDITYEMSHWQNGWYTHGVYHDGLTNENLIIGHWAAENRLGSENGPGASIGAFHQNLIVGWQFDSVNRIEFDLALTDNESYDGNDYDTAYRFNTTWSTYIQSHPISLSATQNKNILGENATTFSLLMEW